MALSNVMLRASEPGTYRFIVSTPSGRKPGLTASTASTLRISKPAPVNKIIANASSATVRIAGARWRRLRFRLSLEWRCFVPRAGITPNRTPTSTERPSVHARTTGSIAASERRARSGGPKAMSARTPAAASAAPSDAETSESTRLSVIN